MCVYKIVYVKALIDSSEGRFLCVSIMELEQGGRERIVHNHVSKVGYVNGVINKRKKPYRRVKRSVIRVPRALQELFVSCKDTFKSPATIPSPHHVQTLCRILDDIKPEDVGLSRDLQFFKPGKNIIKENQRVTYTTMYKCDNFSLCIFFLPESGVIPLHNHPGMTVFSKLLLGKMHIKSYDWVDELEAEVEVEAEPSNNLMQQNSKVRLAKMKANRVLTAPCDTSVLYPTRGGNMHEFTAITPCAVLDVIGPPYSKQHGRDCSYYKDHPYAASSSSEEMDKGKEANVYWWLEEIEVPENSQMDGIEYLGPPIGEPSF